VAIYDDGTPAAYERTHGKGHAAVIGTFVGEQNQLEPASMHPLADALVEWAGLERPALCASAFVELRRLTAPGGEFIFLFNHGAQPAEVECTIPLRGTPKRVREITRAETVPVDGSVFAVRIVLPAETVRVYRIDY
jgi:hypothetical protein